MKLTIEIKSHSDLLDVASRLGDKVTSGVLENAKVAAPAVPSANAEVMEKTPAQKAAETRAAKAAAKAAQPPEAPSIPTHGPSAPAYVPDIQPTAPVAPAPVAPVAPAPVAAPAQVSPQRQQYNEAAIYWVNALKAVPGITNDKVVGTMLAAFAQVGCPQGAKITTITDEEMVRFYPVFEAAVKTVQAGGTVPSSLV